MPGDTKGTLRERLEAVVYTNPRDNNVFEGARIALEYHGCQEVPNCNPRSLCRTCALLRSLEGGQG